MCAHVCVCSQSLLRGDRTMNRYTRLDEEVELSNERYLDDVQSQQQVSHINSHTHKQHAHTASFWLRCVCFRFHIGVKRLLLDQGCQINVLIIAFRN